MHRLILPTCRDQAIFSSLTSVENLRAKAKEGRAVQRRLIGLMAIGLAGAILALAVFMIEPLHAQVRRVSSKSEGGDNRTIASPDDPYPFPPELIGVELMKQSADQAHQKSLGCISCHQNVGDPHFQDTL